MAKYLRLQRYKKNVENTTSILGFQTWIGFSEVKSLPVYFYVQRNKDFSNTDTPILFDIERVNVGAAMNITSGIFTAPRTGRYFFSFLTLIRAQGGSIHLALRMNGVVVGYAFGDSQTYESTSVNTLLELRTGDKIWLAIIHRHGSSYIHDHSNYQYTHFTGWLLDEDLSQTLDYRG